MGTAITTITALWCYSSAPFTLQIQNLQSAELGLDWIGLLMTQQYLKLTVTHTIIYYRALLNSNTFKFQFRQCSDLRIKTKIHLDW